MASRPYEITGPLQRSTSRSANNYYRAPVPPVAQQKPISYEPNLYMDEKYNHQTTTTPLPPQQTNNAPLPPLPIPPPPAFQDASMVTVPADMFDRMFLRAQDQQATAAAQSAHRQFANPTPLSVVGFLLALSPLSCDLMGWRGAGGNGAASM